MTRPSVYGHVQSSDGLVVNLSDQHTASAISQSQQPDLSRGRQPADGLSNILVSDNDGDVIAHASHSTDTTLSHQRSTGTGTGNGRYSIEFGNDDDEYDDDYDDLDLGIPSSQRERQRQQSKVHGGHSYMDVPIVPRPSIGNFDVPGVVHFDPESEADPSTTMSKAELHAELRTTVLVNLALILTWYLFSTGLSVYNRWLFGEKNMNFKYPFFVSAGHMLIQFVLSGLSILAITKLRPKVRPGLRNYFTKAVPCGVASACDIGLSNLSLHSITLSFYTMCKSSSPAFILLFAFLFKLEKPRWQLIGVIVIISGGVFLMAATEVNFVLAGFLQVMAAAAFGGLRWSLTQMLLQRESSGMNNPIASIFYMAPIIGTSLIVASFIFEHPLQLGSTKFFATAHAAWSIIGTIAGGGLLAFMMMLSEFALISRTSVVTLSVAGIFKEIVTIIISMLTFNDKLTILNVVGLLIALVGIALYNVYKITQVRADIERKHNAPSAANDVTNPSSSPSSGPSVPMRRLPDTRQAANGKYSALHDGDDDLNDLGDDDDIEDEDPAAAPSHRPRHP